MKYNRFEELPVWKAAVELALGVFKLTSRPIFRRYYSVRNQLERSAMSVSNNIAEGFERGGDKEFRQFLSLAQGSAGEVKAQLYVALDARFLSQGQFDQLYSLATEPGRLIGGFMRYLTDSGYKGSKFK